MASAKWRGGGTCTVLYVFTNTHEFSISLVLHAEVDLL